MTEVEANSAIEDDASIHEEPLSIDLDDEAEPASIDGAGAPASAPAGDAFSALEAELGDNLDLTPSTGPLGRRTSTTAVHKAAAAFAKHRLPAKGAMAGRLSALVSMIIGWVFTRVDFDDHVIEGLREAHARGQVVHVCETVSRLDYLYFNWALIRHGLPLASFANQINTMLLHGWRVFLRHVWFRRARNKQDYALASFDYHIGSGHTLWIFLNRARGDEDHNLQFSQTYLVRMMEVSERLDKPLIIVPTLLVWDKRPDSTNPGLVDDLFGSSQSPGFFRKAFQFLNMSWQSFFVFGSPIATTSEPFTLEGFRAEYPEADMAEAAELLRERLQNDLETERQVIMGPPLKAKRDIKAEILRKHEVMEVIRKVSLEEDEPLQKVRGRASGQLDEIAAEFNLLGIKTLGAILSPIFHLIYRGFHIDFEGLNRLRATARDSRVILVPSHKSYIDFLVLSYVFYQYGLIPPHIAAGVNLSFWPLGPLFRRCGAFFLRRTFKGDPLYPTVFKQYLVKLLEEGFMIEFFPEGTRSRTGKVMTPRYGMVRMIIDAFIAGRFEKLVFQPISIGYEKLIEGASYSREAKGAEKKSESATDLLKASSVLASNYGRVYIEFAEPLSLTDYMVRYDVDRDNVDEEKVQRLTVRLAHRIMYDIAEVTPVTPSAVAAIVLMNAPGRGIGAERLLLEAGFIIQQLMGSNGATRLTAPLLEALSSNLPPNALEAMKPGGERCLTAEPRGRLTDQKALGNAVAPVLKQAMLLLEQNSLVTIREVHDELFYSLSDKQRVDLNYYKNNIIHFFVAQGLLATSLVQEEQPPTPQEGLDLEEIRQRSLFISRLFKYEFFYKERSPQDVERTQHESAFEYALSLFAQNRWLTVRGDRIYVNDPVPGGLEYMRTLMLPYLEPYHYVCDNLHLLTERAEAEAEPFEDKEFIAELLKRAEVAHLQGEIQYYETISKTSFTNVITWLTDLGVVELTGVEVQRRGRTRYVKTIAVAEAWGEEERHAELAAQIEPFTGRNRRRLDRAL